MLPGTLIFLSRAALAAAIIIISILSFIKIGQPLPGNLSDKFYHALAFFVLSILTHISFPHSGFSFKKYFPLLIYGILIEIVQFFLPYRSFSIADMVADAAGILMYFIFIKAFLKSAFASYMKKRQN